jgi:hypothetical protein
MGKTCGIHGETDKLIYFGHKTEIRRPFRHRGEDNIKMDLKEIQCESVDWMQLAQDHVQW